MKNPKSFLLPVLTGSAALTVFAAVFFPKLPVVGQEAVSEISSPKSVRQVSATTAIETAAQTTVPDPTPQINERQRLVKAISSTKLSAGSALAAASVNRDLKFNLNWDFGKKNQRGWYLYELLIQKTIDTQANAESPEFALALAEWQQKNSLLPTGILDKDCFAEMVKTWQSERLGSRAGYAAEEILITAPITDFYDPTREAALLKVERQTYAAYKQMIAAATKDLSLNLKTTQEGTLSAEEKFLKIVSAFRSREYQQQLRLKSPNSGSAGLAVNSPHFSGQALDIYVGGEPVTTKDFNRAVQVQTPVYQWLVKNAAKFGFRPYFYEPWHWEYVGTTNNDK